MQNAYSVILFLFILAGIFTTVWGWTIIRAAKKTLLWPTTNGIIKTSTPGSEHDAHLPHIVYHYSVSENGYENTLQLPGGTTPSPELANQYVEKFPVGKSVPVSYDPEQPKVSTLEPGPRNGDGLILYIGFGTTLFGVLFLFFSG